MGHRPRTTSSTQSRASRAGTQGRCSPSNMGSNGPSAGSKPGRGGEVRTALRTHITATSLVLSSSSVSRVLCILICRHSCCVPLHHSHLTACFSEERVSVMPTAHKRPNACRTRRTANVKFRDPGLRARLRRLGAPISITHRPTKPALARGQMCPPRAHTPPPPRRS